MKVNKLSIVLRAHSSSTHWCIQWSRVTAEPQQKSLQSRRQTHFTRLILSLSVRWAFLLLAFEVELVEFTGNGWQRLSLRLRQEQADVQRRQQADCRERHKAVLAQLTLEQEAKLSDCDKVKKSRQHDGLRDTPVPYVLVHVLTTVNKHISERFSSSQP